MTTDISGKEVEEMLSEKVLGKKLHISTAAHKVSATDCARCEAPTSVMRHSATLRLSLTVRLLALSLCVFCCSFAL